MDRGLIGSLFWSNYSQKGSIVPASRLIEQEENSINLVQIVQIELRIEETNKKCKNASFQLHLLLHVICWWDCFSFKGENKNSF